MKTFFIEHPYNGSFIAIKQGDTGYYKTTVYDQAHADRLNEINGHTPEDIEAATICSMTGEWSRFDSLVTELTLELEADEEAAAKEQRDEVCD